MCDGASLGSDTCAGHFGPGGAAITQTYYRLVDGVSALAMDDSGDRLIAGHASGRIVLWSLLQGSEAAIKTINDLHVGISIAHISLFQGTGTRQLAVSVDESGVAHFMTYSGLLMGAYTYTRQCLLDGSAGKVSSAEKLERYTSMADVEASVKLLGLCTVKQTYILRLEPQITLLHRIASPVGMSGLAKSLFTWRLDSGRKIDRQDTICFSVSRGREIRLYSLKCGGHSSSDGQSLTSGKASTSGAAAAARRGRGNISTYPDFSLEEAGRYEWEHVIVCLTWLENGALIIVNADGHARVLDSRLNEHDSLHLGAHAPEIPPSTRPLSSTFSSSLDGILILSTDGVCFARFCDWQERIASLELCGDIRGALATALSVHDMCKSDSTISGINDSLLIGPEAKVAIAACVGELVIQYIRQQKAEALRAAREPTMNGPDDNQSKEKTSRRRLMSSACIVAIECCASVGVLDPLFGSVCDLFIDFGCDSIYVQTMEPYLLNQVVTVLSPRVLFILARYYTCRGALRQLESVLLSLRSSRDCLELLLAICHRFRLYTPFARALSIDAFDFVTPAAELLNAATCDLDMLVGGWGETNQAAGEGSKQVTFWSECDDLIDTLDAPPQLTRSEQGLCAQKLILFIRCVLTCRSYPLAEPIESEFEVSKSKAGAVQLTQWLFEACHELGLTRLTRLICLEPIAVFDVLSLAFDLDFVGMEPPADGCRASVARKMSEASSQDLNPLRSTWLSLLDRAAVKSSSEFLFARFAANLHIRGRIILPLSMLRTQLLRLTSSTEEAQKQNRAKGAENAAVLERLLECLLTTQGQFLTTISSQKPKTCENSPPLPAEIWDEVRKACAVAFETWAEFVRPLALMFMFDGFVADALRLLLQSSLMSAREYAVTVAIKFFKKPDNDDETAAKVRELLAESLPLLAEADCLGAAELLTLAWPDEQEQLIGSLDDLPELQWMYMRLVLLDAQRRKKALVDSSWGWASGEPISTVPTKVDPLPVQLEGAGFLSAKTHEHYIGLLCRFAPGDVFGYLQSNDAYRVDVCVGLCEQYDIRDASVYLRERAGDLSGAMDLMLESVRGAIESFIMDDKNLDVSRTENAMCVEMVVTCAADLCQRGCQSQWGDSTKTDVEDDLPASSWLWFALLDALLEYTSFMDSSTDFNKPYAHQVMRRCAQLVLGRMVTHLPMEVVLRHVLEVHSNDTLGDFRSVIADVLATWQHQRYTLSRTCLISECELSKLLLCHGKLARRGWQPINC